MWWSYWYFHFTNYAFAVLFWTLIGRFMFAIFLPPDSPNYIYRWFRRLTDWLMRPVAYVTPSIVPPLALAPIATTGAPIGGTLRAYSEPPVIARHGGDTAPCPRHGAR